MLEKEIIEKEIEKCKLKCCRNEALRFITCNQLSYKMKQSSKKHEVLKMQYDKQSEEYDKKVRDYSKLNQRNKENVKEFSYYENMSQNE